MNAEQKERKKEYDKKWQKENRSLCSGYARKWREAHKEQYRKYMKRWSSENKDKIKEYKHEDYLKHKERYVQSKNRWHAQNPEKVREAVRKSCRKMRSTPRGHLSSSISRGIAYSISKGTKGGNRWEALVGYTVDQLKIHLEKQFIDGMSWDNYGPVWHIDHKIPISAFNFKAPEDIDFKKCWSLKNLQPMWAFDNMSKHDRIDKPFQPSLAISGGSL